MVGAECAPAAKAGGLGDSIQGLSRELIKRGNEVDVILPKYDCLRWDRIDGLHKAYEDLWVPFYEQSLPCDVDCGYVDGIRCFFANEDIAHIRPSGNAPQLRLYACADTQIRAEEIVAMGIREPDGILRRLAAILET